MGEDSAVKRELGPWTLKEGLALFENVCKATEVKAMRQSMTVKYPTAATTSKSRYEVDETKGEIRVFDENKVQLKEILPHVMKPKRAYNSFIATGEAVSISWKAISEHM